MRCIGQGRARVWIGLVNQCYNMRRFCYLEREAEAVQGALCQEYPKEGGSVYKGLIKGLIWSRGDWIDENFAKTISLLGM